MDKSTSQLWAITGPRGAGKTAFCRLMARHARCAGWDVAGLLSPATVETGVKTGILAEDLRTGEVRVLACATACSPFNLPLGKWYIDTAVLVWGNCVLKTCLPCDLMIVDELGPLELLHGGGWSEALTFLGQSAYRLGLVVVRPELLETIRTRLPVAGTIFIDTPLCLERDAQQWWEQLIHEPDV